MRDVRYTTRHLTYATHVTPHLTPHVGHMLQHTLHRSWAPFHAPCGLKRDAAHVQDCLNRMLLASSLRWAPLPPALFPNGFVFFRRPLEPAGRPATSRMQQV